LAVRPDGGRLPGFDAPILYCMYLDKPMRDHVLLQAIARVNRPYEDDSGRRKPAGFVLDFVGIFDNLEKALAFDSKDIEGVVEGLDVLKEHFRQLMERGRTKFLAVTAGLTGDKAVEAILEGFRDANRRDEFYQYFRKLQEVYEILSPDEFLRPFLEDYQRLSEMYQILRASYEARPITSSDFLRKTAQLVQEHTRSLMVREPEVIYGIDPTALRRLASEDCPDVVKVFNLLKAIRQIVREQASAQPYLISIGERAEAIIRDFEERQITTQEALRQLVEGPVTEIEAAEQARKASDLSPEAFAVFQLLQHEGINSAETVARKIAAVLDEYCHWRVSEQHEREARKGIYKALVEAGVKEVGSLANRLLYILRRSEE